MTPAVDDHQLSLAIGGLRSVGPGIAGYTAWIVAGAVILGLAALARWTMRPARRATRAELRLGRRRARRERQAGH